MNDLIHLIDTLRKLNNNKYSVKATDEKLNLSRQIITRYLDANVSTITGNYNVKRKIF